MYCWENFLAQYLFGNTKEGMSLVERSSPFYLEILKEPIPYFDSFH
jgi:hypothetical protein